MIDACVRSEDLHLVHKDDLQRTSTSRRARARRKSGRHLLQCTDSRTKYCGPVSCNRPVSVVSSVIFTGPPQMSQESKSVRTGGTTAFVCHPAKGASGEKYIILLPSVLRNRFCHQLVEPCLGELGGMGQGRSRDRGARVPYWRGIRRGDACVGSEDLHLVHTDELLQRASESRPTTGERDANRAATSFTVQ